MPAPGRSSAAKVCSGSSLNTETGVTDLLFAIVQYLKARDAEDPGFEVRAGGKLSAFPPDGRVGVLGHVPGGRVARQQADCT